MKLEEYLADLPKLHTWDGGRTWNTGGFERSHFEPLHHLITEEPRRRRILETGCGNSTIFFLLHEPEALTTIDPDSAVMDRVARFCDRHGIDRSTHETHSEPSDVILPLVAKRSGNPFDFILIDGGHGWPDVMVDLCYALKVLAPDGYVMLDDIQVHAVKELARCLVEQPGFEIALDLGKALVFRRRGDFCTMPGWWNQPYIVRRTQKDREAGSEFQLDHW